MSDNNSISGNQAMGDDNSARFGQFSDMYKQLAASIMAINDRLNTSTNPVDRPWADIMTPSDLGLFPEHPLLLSQMAFLAPTQWPGLGLM